MALGHVGVDQQDGAVPLASDALGQVERGERLALPGNGAGHHDTVRVPPIRRNPGQRNFQYRPLDAAELVGEQVHVLLGRHHSLDPQLFDVERDALGEHPVFARAHRPAGGGIVDTVRMPRAALGLGGCDRRLSGGDLLQLP